MAKAKAVAVETNETPEQREAKAIRRIRKADRTKEQKERLKELVTADKRDRFVRIAGKRIRAARTAINRLARCGNKVTFHWLPGEDVWIMDEISKACEGLARAFSPDVKANGILDTAPWEKRS